MPSAALPHRLTEEDVYEGYRLPAGSLVFANTWYVVAPFRIARVLIAPRRAILHDPEIYPDPMEFQPERYLGPQAPGTNPDPRAFAFGYGRRSVHVPRPRHT